MANPVKIVFQAVPWVVGGVVVMEGYALATNTNPLLPDFGLNNALKGIINQVGTFIGGIFGGTPPGGNPPPCNGKTCPTGQHLNLSTCTCVSDTGCGAKTCPTGQHLDTACNCVSDAVCQGKVCAAGQHLDPNCNCVPDVTIPPPGTLQNGYQGSMSFITPREGLRWPSHTLRVIVDTHETAGGTGKAADVTAVTLVIDNQPVPMNRYSGGLWDVTIPVTSGSHTVRATSTYKNGWSTGTGNVSFTVL